MRYFASVDVLNIRMREMPQLGRAARATWPEPTSSLMEFDPTPVATVSKQAARMADRIVAQQVIGQPHYYSVLFCDTL